MNRKIYDKIVETVKASPAIMFNGSSMQNAIRGIFDVNIQVSDQDDLIKIADKTDKAVLEKYFAEVWQSKTKSYNQITPIVMYFCVFLFVQQLTRYKM